MHPRIDVWGNKSNTISPFTQWDTAKAATRFVAAILDGMLFFLNCMKDIMGRGRHDPCDLYLPYDLSEINIFSKILSGALQPYLSAFKYLNC